MSSLDRPRICGVASLVLLLGLSGLARAEAPAQQWTLATTSVWPPAIVDGKLVLKSGDTLSAHNLADGKLVWRKKLDGLRYGAGVLAAGARYIYVLGGMQLYLVDPADGKVVRKKPLASPSYVYYQTGSVYVVARDGLLRFDHSATKLLGRAPGVSGEIRGADGDYVVLYHHGAKTKRLLVVNLRTKKQTYEFKLLPKGWHRVVKVGGDRVMFLDYSQRSSDGKNPKKLYFTEADYVRSKKIKDKALHTLDAAAYASADSDRFWTATNASGIVFIGNHGAPGAHSALLAFDPSHDKVLWTRQGEVLQMGLLLHDGALWSGVTDRDGNASAVVYSPDDGSLLGRLPLDSPGVGAPVAAGERVLLRTRKSVYCFSRASQPASAPASRPAAQADGWRTYRDRVLGYTIRAPSSWTFARDKMVALGGMRMSIPFFRTETRAGKLVYLGSVHVLTYEAAGRDLNSQWSSVYNQRRRLNPDVKVTRVHRVRSVGGSGQPGILAHYSFRGRSGRTEQMRSLCLIAHGVAFELRGWVGPQGDASVWRQVQGILNSFKPIQPTGK